MTAETRHHPSGPLSLALSLAAVAGFVDAYLFLHVANVFVANMSGNMVHLGILLGEGDWASAIGPAAALLAFGSGVAVAIAHHDDRLRQGMTINPNRLLVVEAFLILLLPIILLTVNVDFSHGANLIDYPALMIGAFAMGIQASTLRRVGDIAVATTYGTGTIVRIGEKAALAARRAERQSPGARSATLVVLTSVLVAYVAGAALAAAVGASPLVLLMPTGVLFGFAALMHFDDQFRSAFAGRSRQRQEP